MRSHARTVVALALASCVAVSLAPACGSSDSGGGGAGGSAGGGGTAIGGNGGTGGTDQKPPKDSCGQPGDKGNENGVGTYCTPGGMQCRAFPLAGLCLADVGQDQWFCSRIGCSKDVDCGSDATCVKQQGSSGCVPNRCLDNGTGGSGGGSGGSNAGGAGGSGGSASGGGGSSSGGAPGN